MNWLAALWRQAFSDKCVIAPEQYLRANVTLGLFTTVVLYVCVERPEQFTPALTLLLALTVLTHLGGWWVAKLMPDRQTLTVFVQGAVLGLTSFAAVAIASWLNLRAAALTNVRYVPGVALHLLLHASLEMQRCAPDRVRHWAWRKAGLFAGISIELGLLVTLLW